MSFRKAFRDLFARKLRTLLVVLSIAVGVFGISAIGIAGEQIEQGNLQQTERSRPPDITVPAGAGKVFTEDTRTKVADIANVERAQGRIAGPSRWKRPNNDDREEFVDLIGVDSFDNANTLDVPSRVRGIDQQEESNWPKEGEILFDIGSRKYAGLKVGQTVTLLDADKTEHKLKVSGFGEKPGVLSGGQFGRAAAWLNRADALKVLKLDGDNLLLVKLRNNSTAKLREDTNDLVRKRLEDEGITIGDSVIREPGSFSGKETLDALRSMSLVFAAVGAFASALLVINTISTIVVEQRGQIGSMKAVGATTGQIMRLYVLLALLYGILGTLFGLLGGLGLNVLGGVLRGLALDKEPTLPTVSSDILLQAVAVGLGVSVFAALLPAWRGARTTIREAIASYGLSADFGNSPWDRLVGGIGFLPQSAKLASRNVFRQASRALLTIVGLAVATAATLAVLAGLTALAMSFDAASKVLKTDLTFTFQAPVGSSAVDDALKDTTGIDRRELWLSGSSKFKGTTTSVLVRGLPTDTDLFDRNTVRNGGAWIGADKDDEAIVTRRLAEARKLKVGDSVEVELGDRSATWKIVGIVGGAGGDAQAPNGVIYAPIESVRTLLGLPEGLRNVMYVRLADGPAKAGVAPGSLNQPDQSDNKKRVDDAANTIGDALANANLTVTPTKVYQETQGNQAALVPIRLLFGLTLVVVASVGALGLFSTLTMNVLERRKEIGVMRSVGAPTGTLLWTYLLEGVLLGLLGWAIGAALGGPAGERLVAAIDERLIPVDFSLPSEIVVTTLVVVIVVALLSSIGPALAAARMRIAEILRYN